MAEIVCAGSLAVLTDKAALCVGDAFRYADDDVRSVFQRISHILYEFLHIEGDLRQIDEHRIITGLFSGQRRGSGKPACVASHKLYDRHRLLFIDGSVQHDVPHGGRHILGRTAVAGGMICLHQIVVDGLWHADKSNGRIYFSGITGKLVYRIHGIIAADIEEIADLQLFQFFKETSVYRHFHLFRQFIAARTQICRRCSRQQHQRLLVQRIAQIHISAFQKAFYSIDHAVDAADLFLSEGFFDHAAQTGIDYCCRAAGLSNQYIFHMHIAPYSSSSSK